MAATLVVQHSSEDSAVSTQLARVQRMGDGSWYIWTAESPEIVDELTREEWSRLRKNGRVRLDSGTQLYLFRQ